MIPLIAMPLLIASYNIKLINAETSCNPPNIVDPFGANCKHILTSLRTYPHLALINIFYSDGSKGPREPFNGAILTDEYVLSVERDSFSCYPECQYQIVIGAESKGENGKTYHAEIIRHENFIYDSVYGPLNNIVLYKTNQSMVFGIYSRPVRKIIGSLKSGTRSVLEPGTKASLVGYPRIFANEQSYGIRETQVIVYDKNRCNRQLERESAPLPDGFFCAGGWPVTEFNTCKGHVGASLMIGDQLAGLSSNAQGKLTEMYGPDVFVNVTYFIDWIKDKVKLERKPVY